MLYPTDSCSKKPLIKNELEVVDGPTCSRSPAFSSFGLGSVLSFTVADLGPKL